MRMSSPAQSMGSNATRRLRILALAASCLVPLAAAAGVTTYTLDGEFDLGVLSGVNHDAPNNHQLQLNRIGTTFPVLWVANAGEDTLSKIDTVNNKEIGRYRTWFGSGAFGNHGAFSGPAPSRSAVDIQGNAYILNRHFDNRRPMLMKVLAEGFIDRNSNGVADTSEDANISGSISAGETKNVADTNSNGLFDCSAASCESQDERVAWTSTLPASEAGGLGRSLCIGTDGNLWVGIFNTRRFYKISAADGSILSGPHAVGWTPYGCLVDGDGILWSASLGTSLGKLDTNNPAATAVFNDSSSANYGIALGNGKVYLASQSGTGYREFNPTTSTFSTPGGSKSYSSTGISVDGSGNIWTGPYTSAGVRKYNAAGGLLCSGASQFPGAIETRGVIVDSENNVWQINRHTNSVAKYRGSDCAPLGNYPVGFDPYTYSDATGFAARNITTPTGTWTVINNSGVAGQAWSQVSWTELVPTGAGVQVSARSADVLGNLASLPYQPVGNGANPGLTGRFIQVLVRLNANANGDSPILYDLSLRTPDGQCDADRDGDIDKSDLSLISRGRGQTALPGDPRDSDGDGKITPNDVKVCIPLCTRANCAVQ